MPSKAPNFPDPPESLDLSDLPNPNDNVGLALAYEHLESEFKNFIILGCNRDAGLVLVEAHVDDASMMIHMKNQLAHVCRALEPDATH